MKKSRVLNLSLAGALSLGLAVTGTSGAAANSPAAVAAAICNVENGTPEINPFFAAPVLSVEDLQPGHDLEALTEWADLVEAELPGMFIEFFNGAYQGEENVPSVMSEFALTKAPEISAAFIEVLRELVSDWEASGQINATDTKRLLTASYAWTHDLYSEFAEVWTSEGMHPQFAAGLLKILGELVFTPTLGETSSYQQLATSSMQLPRKTRTMRRYTTV